MLYNFWNGWLLVAFVAPFLWALVNVIDVYFSKEVYQDEYDGAIVSGFFQIIPWLLAPFINVAFPDLDISLLAVLGGFLFCFAMLFYFKVIFTTGDATLLQIFWNLTALVVPILTFFIFKERLSNIHYLGILITFAGATFLSFHRDVRANNFKKFLFIMSGAIIFLSLSMVVQDAVYSRTNFFSGLLFFALGYLIGSILILLSLPKKKNKPKHLYEMSKKYFGWFCMIESINLVAIVFSQRAIDISPSVSYIAAIESFVPAFILILSLAIFIAFTIFSLKKKDIMKAIYNDQIIGLSHKIAAIIIMATGIFLIAK